MIELRTVPTIDTVHVKPGLHVRRKHKNKHKHKHKDVYKCDKHKHNVTYASAEAAET